MTRQDGLHFTRSRPGDVTLDDCAHFPGCMTGPNSGPVADGCAPLDFEPDDDVDLTDFGGFQVAFTGSGQERATARQARVGVEKGFSTQGVARAGGAKEKELRRGRPSTARSI